MTSAPQELNSLLGEVVPAGGVADAAALKLEAKSALGGAVLAMCDARKYATDIDLQPR